MMRATKRLETDASKRFVPIHSELKKIGFLTYVMKMQRAGEVGSSRTYPKVSGAITATLSRNGSVVSSPTSVPRHPRQVFTVSVTAIVMLSEKLTFLRSEYGR